MSVKVEESLDVGECGYLGCHCKRMRNVKGYITCCVNELLILDITKPLDCVRALKVLRDWIKFDSFRHRYVISIGTRCLPKLA